MPGASRKRAAVLTAGAKTSVAGKGAIRRRAAPAGADFEQFTGEYEQLVVENQQLIEALADVEASLERYADYYDSSPIAHVTLDESGVIREINRAACALLKAQRSKLLACPFRSVVVTRERGALARHLSSARKRGRARSRLNLQLADETVIPIELVTRRAAGRRECYPTAIIDAREAEQAAQDRAGLVETTRSVLEKSQAKDQFFAMVSHELRAPLAPLLSAVGALEYRQVTNPEVRKLCEIIRRNVNAQARLVDDLLDATRLARGKLTIRREPGRVHRMVRQAIDLFAAELAEKKMVLALGLDAAQDLVDGDPTRLRQVFANLIRNAVKFTPSGGAIEVRTWNSAGRIAVEVSDSGIGIEPNLLPRLFSPFEQLNPQSGGTDPGMGLGLAIAKGVMELHGGTITATSAGRGRGTRFVVDLPLLAERTPAANRGAPATRTTILLVEDNPDTAAALMLALGSCGYVVKPAASIAAALEVNLAKVDLILSDLRLPDGDGWGLLRELRKKTAVPAIALSGYDGEADVSASHKAGFVAHLTKPIDMEALNAAIERALAAKVPAH